MPYHTLSDLELRMAKASMNADVTDQLLSRPVFDPASLDCQPPDPMCTVGTLTVDEALELDDGRVTMSYGSVRPWMSWEIWL
jgi:hypothetical protein